MSGHILNMASHMLSSFTSSRTQISLFLYNSLLNLNNASSCGVNWPLPVSLELWWVLCSPVDVSHAHKTFTCCFTGYRHGLMSKSIVLQNQIKGSRYSFCRVGKAVQIKIVNQEECSQWQLHRFQRQPMVTTTVCVHKDHWRLEVIIVPLMKSTLQHEEVGLSA